MSQNWKWGYHNKSIGEHSVQWVNGNLWVRCDGHPIVVVEAADGVRDFLEVICPDCEDMVRVAGRVL